jgi:type IV secretion system protein TrbL
MEAWKIADEFLARIVGLVDSGFGLIQGEVFGLTAILIAVTFGVLGFKFVLAGEEAKSILVQFFFKVLFVGFMVWIIKAWPTLYREAGEYFQALGGTAGGVGNATDMLTKPSRVMESMDLATAPITRTIDELGGAGYGTGQITNGGKIFSLEVAQFFIQLAFFVSYVNLFFTVVEFHAVALAAWPFLAFSVFKGSTFLAERPMGFVFGVGAKLLVMTMLLGFSLNYFDTVLLPADPTINQSLTTAMMAFLIMVFALLVPAVAAALISGGPMLSAAVPMMMAAGTAMAMTGAVQAMKAAATSAPAKAVGSATASAASRAAGSFNQSFSAGGAAHTAMSAMRGPGAASGAAASTATAAAPQRGAGAASSIRAASTARRPTGGGQRSDFLQRVRNAIPPGTDGHASGNAPRLSDGDI